jgi:hypothetical protein
MDHFGTGALDDTPHDIDGGIVTVKERTGGKDSNFVFTLVRLHLVHYFGLYLIAKVKVEGLKVKV